MWGKIPTNPEMIEELRNIHDSAEILFYGVNRPIPRNYRRHPGDTAPISMNVRPLTTIERSYIQTFPKGFVFEGSKTDLEQMIGNAVPVKLAEYVAKSIIAFSRKCEEEKENQAKEYQYQLKLG